MPYQFSLPSVNDLSQGQKIALAASVEEVFIISGCPGSGKTTVALLRAKGKGNDPRHHYTVWANLLYGYLLNISNLLDVSEEHFSTFFSWLWRKYGVSGYNSQGFNSTEIVTALRTQGIRYDEFQLDEGQDLPLDVRCALSHITRKLVICMDPAQDVNNICDNHDDEISLTIKKLTSIGKKAKAFKLGTNWRNTKPVFDFAKAIVPELNSQTSNYNFSKLTGKKPDVYELQDEAEIIAKMVEIVQNERGRNIGIFDSSLHKLKIIAEKLNSQNINVTFYNSKEFRTLSRLEKKRFLSNMSNIVLSTFISCKGLEFNTVMISNINNMTDNLKDKKGYYVGCTRAQDRLILFRDRSNYNLPNWFQGIDNTLYTIQGKRENSNLF